MAEQALFMAFPDVATRDAQWVSPPVGASCITTDTGTQWLRVSSTAWYKAMGRIYHFSITTAFTGIGTGGTDLFTTAGIVIPANRLLVCVVSLSFTTVNNGPYVLLKMDGSAQPGRMCADGNLGSGGHLIGEYAITPSAGTHTFGITIAALASTVNLTCDVDPGYFEIRDMGSSL